ncbi:AidA/PixA family protein [Myxococcus sp. Y35]|uniref:AidA/PixA family protein n=1 Tax=Pseudomyxococcus flavus TaxID=3115648 RepID=UPI003CF447B1
MAQDNGYVDILTVVDVDKVISEYGPNASLDDPGVAIADCVYMIVRRSDADGAEAIPELTVDVSTNDILRWRLVSLTLNTRYSAVLYKMTVSENPDCITQPQPLVSSVMVPVPEVVGGQPGGFNTQPYKDFYFQATALQPTATVPGQKVTYQLYVQVTDNKGNKVGTYSWDPFITITS